MPTCKGQWLRSLLALFAFAVASWTSEGDAPARTLLRTYCVNCHSADKAKAGLDIGTLDHDLAQGIRLERWTEALDAIRSGAMPPAGKPQPTPADRAMLGEWLDASLRSAVRRTAAAPAMRRLNVMEYRNSIRAVLGIPFDPTTTFGNDPLTAGFDTVGDGLIASPQHVENWLTAAEDLLERVLVDPATPAPQCQHWRITDIDWRKSPPAPAKGASAQPGAVQPGPGGGGPSQLEVIVGNPTMHRLAQPLEDLIAKRSWDSSSILGVWASGPNGSNTGEEFIDQIKRLSFCYSMQPAGVYRVRLTASGSVSRPDLPPPTLTPRLYPEGRVLTPISLGTQPQTMEFTIWRDAWQESLPYNGRRSWGMDFVFRTALVAPHPPTARMAVVEAEVANVTFHSLEIEGPIFDAWPPRWHRDLLPGTSPAELDAALRRLAERAWRGPVADAELAPARALLAACLAGGKTPIAAARSAMALVLASPRFLYLRDRGAADGRLGGHALADRLAYFLWSAPPDVELRRAADAGELARPDALLAQARRMLADPQLAEGLGLRFPTQWLRLDEVMNVAPNATLYPYADKALMSAMVGETLAFFNEILMGRAPLTALIECDFAMLNERMAHHYGIPDVSGPQFRRVALRPEWRRGGLLSQAGILSLTANGTRTSPVHRGAYILERILDDPPPPPPADAGQLEETVPAKEGATVRERLETHRRRPDCAACHARIDPYGFALEAYGALGEYRTRERIIADTPMLHPRTRKPVVLIVENTRYAVPVSAADGSPVQTSARLVDGRAFDDLAGLQRLLRDDADRVIACVARRLLTYATGYEAGLIDRPLIDQLVKTCRADGDSLPSLILALVASDRFRQRGPLAPTARKP